MRVLERVSASLTCLDTGAKANETFWWRPYCSVDNVELLYEAMAWFVSNGDVALAGRMCILIEETVSVSRFSTSCCNQCILLLLMIRLSRCEARKKRKETRLRFKSSSLYWQPFGDSHSGAKVSSFLISYKAYRKETVSSARTVSALGKKSNVPLRHVSQEFKVYIYNFSTSAHHHHSF